jgi:glycosyltransferase involved in cell wall biosynthesis
VVRLGLYIDALYRDGENGGPALRTNAEALPFLLFGCEVGAHFDEVVLFGRRAPAGVGADLALPAGPSLVALPWYPSLADTGRVARASIQTVARLWRGLERVDVVWVFGPHPFALVLVLLALLRRRRVVLGVRQDTMAYFRSRLRRRVSAPLLAPLWVLAHVWRGLARTLPTTVVGPELERDYGGPRSGLLAMVVSLVRVADVQPAVAARSDSRAVSLLTVGRIEPEKHPLLLVEALAELIGGDDREWRLTWVGTGRLSESVRRRAEELGISGALELPGFVAPGEALLARYHAADLLVHVAVTEGLPQVLLEALATGTPIVATAVGGVAATLEHGNAGWLVPPRDRDALVRTIRAAVDDVEGRLRRARRGLAIAREHALEPEAARVARWLAGAAPDGGVPS